MNTCVHQTALVKTVFTNAVVPPRHLSAVTHSVAPVTANQVSLDHTAMSLAQLADGVQTVRSLVLVLTEHATQYLETALVIEVGRGCFATNPVPAVVSPVQCVTTATDLVYKPRGSVFATQGTKEVHVWSRAVLVTMVKSVRGNVIVLMVHFVIT